MDGYNDADKGLEMNHKAIAVLPIIVFLSTSLFINAYAIDNNCPINIIHILQVTPALLCLEDRIDVLENAPSGSGEANTASNIGTSGKGVFSNKIGVDLQFKKLVSSNNATLGITDNGTNVIFIPTAGSESTVCNNLGTSGITICTGGNVNLRRILSAQNSTRLSVQANSTNIILDNKAPESTACNNLGTSGRSFCVSGNLDFRKLITTNNSTLTITHNGTNVIIGNGFNCANVGSFAQVYKDGNCNFRTLKGSPDISIVQGTNDITIDFNGTGSGEANTASCDSYINGQCLFAQKSGIDLQFKRITTIDPSVSAIDSNSSHIIFANYRYSVMAYVYQSKTMTNIGNAYVDVYVTLFDAEEMNQVFCSFRQIGVILLWDYVGTGTQQVRIVNANNNAQVLWESATFTADQVGTFSAADTSAAPLNAFCNGSGQGITIELQGKSTVAGDDPIARGYVVLVR